jgi:hypothetical protein
MNGLFLSFRKFLKACVTQWKGLIESVVITVALVLFGSAPIGWRLPTWLSLVAIALCWLPAPFLAWRRERLAVSALEQKLAPRLEMRFLDDTRTYCDLRDEPTGPYRLFRVGIKNVGGTSVDDVEVKLQHIEPPVWTYESPSLTAMHYEQGPLNPGAERFFDVVDQLAHGVVRLLPAPGQEIPSTSHTLTLEAYGRNVAPCSGVFVVDFTPSGAGGGPLLVLRRLSNPQ